MRYATLWITAALCVSVFVGCGKGNRTETAKVSGVVALDGKPLTTGTVIFTPEKGRAATGLIQPDGTYSLSTYGTNDGAVLGRHQVAVVARESGTSHGPLVEGSGKWLIPQHYSDNTQSGLSFEVKSDSPNIYDIQLHQ